MKDNCQEFLELYRLCQTAKSCMGQDCRPISEAVIAKAAAIELDKKQLPVECSADSHDCSTCMDCQGVRYSLDGLRLLLEAEGCNFPPGIIS